MWNVKQHQPCPCRLITSPPQRLSRRPLFAGFCRRILLSSAFNRRIHTRRSIGKNPSVSLRHRCGHRDRWLRACSQHRSRFRVRDGGVLCGANAPAYWHRSKSGVPAVRHPLRVLANQRNIGQRPSQGVLGIGARFPFLSTISTTAHVAYRARSGRPPAAAPALRFASRVI
jgi:hypothetical protein